MKTNQKIQKCELKQLRNKGVRRPDFPPYYATELKTLVKYSIF